MCATPNTTDSFILNELVKVSLFTATCQICKIKQRVNRKTSANRFWLQPVKKCNNLNNLNNLEGEQHQQANRFSNWIKPFHFGFLNTVYQHSNVLHSNTCMSILCIHLIAITLAYKNEKKGKENTQIRIN